jgi:hypothetical protein
MGILGFVLGAFLVLVVRGLQSMDPVWDAGTGLVFGVLFCAGFFVWGMGAFDPAMSAHGDAAHADETHANPDDAPPAALVGGITWQIAALLSVSIAVLFAVGAYSGLGLVITAEPLASNTLIGMNPVTVADLAHLIILLIITPVVLIVPLVGLFLFGIWLLRPPQDGTKRSTQNWLLRLALILGLFGLGPLLIPLWFDTVTPLRGPPLPLILFTIPTPISQIVTDWVYDGLLGLFGGATTIYVSQLVFFIGFISVMIVSLLVVGGGLGLIFFALSRGLVTSKVEAEVKAKRIAARAERQQAAATLASGTSAVAALPGGGSVTLPDADQDDDDLDKPALWMRIVATVARTIARILRGAASSLQ